MRNYSTKLIRAVTLLISVYCTGPALASDLSVDWYGRLDIAYDWFEPGPNDWFSHASRIGVRGDYALSDSLDIVYQLEQRVNIAHGGTDIDSLFRTRNSFIGLGGQYGQIMWGRHDTPFKKAQGKIDLFDDQPGDIAFLVAGEVKVSDSFFYHSPTWNGFAARVMHVPEDSHMGSSQSYSLTFTDQYWTLGFALDSNMRKNDLPVSRTNVYDSTRGSVRYTPGAWAFGLLLQSSKKQNIAGANRESAVVTSMSYRASKLTFKAQYGISDIVSDDVKSFNAGIDYHLRENTKLYLYYWDYDNSAGLQSVSLGLQAKF